MGAKSLTSGHWLAIGGALVLVVLLLIAPVKPPKQADQMVNLDLEQEIDSAIALVTSGNMPMQGIQALLALEKAHPEHERVIFNLAMFSVKSGQFDKARGRFGKLTVAVPDNAEYWFHLAMCDYQLQDIDKAKREFEKVVEVAPGTELSESAEKYLNDLKSL